MRAIITGANGQDGSYLAQFLLSKGYTVISVLRAKTSRIENHRLLGIDGQVDYEDADLTNLPSVIALLTRHQPTEIYNLAAQSSVSRSFREPIDTITYNVVTLLNLLEAVRRVDGDIRLYHASSSEMYGNVDCLPITLSTQMRPASPYAVSKASAFWALNTYRESFDLKVASGMLFNHESILRPKTFFVKKVVADSVQIFVGARQHLEVGNIDIRRDFGYAPEYVKAMWLMLQRPVPKDYIICSGRSILLRDIITYVFDKLGIGEDRIVVNQELVRPTDIADIYGDNANAREELGWQYAVNFFDVIDEMLAHELALNGVRT
jgi:GDPmannose 4,6-dehydratase